MLPASPHFLRLFGNSVIIHIIRTDKSIKTTTSYLILNQACADLVITSRGNECYSLQFDGWEGSLVWSLVFRGAVAKWWERSPPTNVSWVRFPGPASYVGWVCCWFSSLLREVFLRVLWFSLSLKTNISKFQFDLDYCHALYHEPLARVIA